MPIFRGAPDKPYLLAARKAGTGFRKSRQNTQASNSRQKDEAVLRPAVRPREGAQEDGQAKPAIGPPSALSGLTRSGPRRSAKAMGPPTRSPGKHAAAAPWPGRPNTQLENPCTQHRAVTHTPSATPWGSLLSSTGSFAARRRSRSKGRPQGRLAMVLAPHMKGPLHRSLDPRRRHAAPVRQNSQAE